jgi:hypothetical protein
MYPQQYIRNTLFVKPTFKIVVSRTGSYLPVRFFLHATIKS